jgi:hypothetical protein
MRMRISIFTLLFILVGTAIVGVYLYSLVRERFVARHDERIHDLHQKLCALDSTLCTLPVKLYDKSEIVNKTNIYICGKKSDGSYYDENTLVYVLCHEYAHALCNDSDGHSDIWHGIFDKLLLRAQYMGLYDPDIPFEQNYCGYT